MFRKKQQKKEYDRENSRAVLRCSICTGEQVAGFKNIHNGHFEEIVLIQNEQDLERFKNIYGIDRIEKEY